VRAPDQLENVTTEDWRSLHLDIQVCFPSLHPAHSHVLVTDIMIDILRKHNSVNTIDDALARISHLQHVELGPSGLSEASQKVLIEGLPPVLVVHLKRFLYDAAADGIVKISKPVWFGPELEIPLGTIVPLLQPR
jgi:ubiquitin carboxyl-terminal hydrolase 10